MSDLHTDEALAILRRIEPALHTLNERVVMIDNRLTRIEAQWPHMATKADVLVVKADLATKPSKAEFWAGLAALIAIYALILASLAFLLPRMIGHT